MNTKEITLPSGAILKITLSPFAVSKALYQAVLEEAKLLKVDAETELDVNLFKDMFCLGFSSKRIESCLTECMKRVLYNDRHVTDDTFEPEDARQDYVSVLWEVAHANLYPFMKSLMQQFNRIQANVPQNLKSK